MISESAARDLFAEYHGRLMAFFRGRGLSTEDAQDLTQETFLKSAKAWETRRATGSLPAWIFRIARHVLYDHWRRFPDDGRNVSLETGKPAGSFGDLPAPPGDDPEQIAQAAMTRDRIEALLEEMDPRTRRMIQLKEAGFKNKEIGILLRMPVETCRGRIRDGRRRLRDGLEEDTDD